MPVYSQRSQDKLSTCDADLQTIFNEVIKYFDCTVICGQRGEEEQNNAYDKGYSQLKYPKSRHNKNPSLAVDVVPYPVEWKNTERMKHFAGYVLGIARLLKDRKIIDSILIWGGDWNGDTLLKNNNFQDFPHYQIK